MVNYQNSKIYKIESHLGNKIYIGSTTKEYLSQRMDSHRSEYKRWKLCKTKKITAYEIFDEYGLDNCNIVLIESFTCNDVNELRAKEAHFIKTLTCVNKAIPGRTLKEWYVDNREEKLKQCHEWYVANKEKMTEYHAIYRKENKEKRNECLTCLCESQYKRKNKSLHVKSDVHLHYLQSLILT